jgi:protein-S-isoprenylcysteine O-methyltransferase Ste14
MFKLGVFVALSALLAYLSRASLRVPQSHGFFRFFAAVFVLALILLNVEHWFVDPLSARQVVSWVLLAVSAVLVLCGALTLRAVGHPGSERTSDVPIAGIERTTALVSTGIYKYIRHPMYASGIYGTWGVFFKDPSWLGVVFALGSSAFWVMSARSEERECICYFGEAYREYVRGTRMFVPFLL